MNCLFFLFASSIVSEGYSQLQEVLDYFESDSVNQFRKQWDMHRKPLEHAITLAVKETVGFGGMNVYIKKTKEQLAKGYFHNDNEVRLILTDLTYGDTPHCVLPEVQFSLASNVLKIQTSLSKIVVHADYALMRNETALLFEPKDQDPLKSSPFLFQQVQQRGRVAIDMEECLLKGFIIATLNGESVNLGYENLKIVKCQYMIEIYNPDERSPPVIARYNPYRRDTGVSIAKLLMTPINNDLMPKLQAAMFSFINTSAIFGSDLQKFRQTQEEIFQRTTTYITEVIRTINTLTINKNHGAVDMEDFHVYWDDGTVHANASTHDGPGEMITLRDMVLTGLDTVYSAHSGGPLKLNSPVIAEEIRFSSLQVRGTLDLKSQWSDKYAFSVELYDMAVDLQLDVYIDDMGNEDTPPVTKTRVQKIEVKGFRRMTFAVPTQVFRLAEPIIGGHVINVVPKIIHAHLKSTLPGALILKPKPQALSNTYNNLGHNIIEEMESSSTYDDEDSPYVSPWGLISSWEVHSAHEEPMRNVFKNKKRFKSAFRPYARSYKQSKLKTKSGSRKHAADNQIRKE